MTVADAKWLSDRLKDAPEAKNQIAFADVIILNKTDLVSRRSWTRSKARIRAINPYAKLHRTQNAAVPLDEVLDRNAFDLDRILEIEPRLPREQGHHHHHDDGHAVRSAKHIATGRSARSTPKKFMPWITT